MLGLSFLSLLAACMEDLFWYSCETFVTLFQKTCTGTKQGPFSPVLNLWMNHTSQIWRIWWLEDDRNLVFTKYCSTVREIGRDVVCTHEHIHTHTQIHAQKHQILLWNSLNCVNASFIYYLLNHHKLIWYQNCVNFGHFHLSLMLLLVILGHF